MFAICDGTELLSFSYGHNGETGRLIAKSFLSSHSFYQSWSWSIWAGEEI